MRRSTTQQGPTVFEELGGYVRWLEEVPFSTVGGRRSRVRRRFGEGDHVGGKGGVSVGVGAMAPVVVITGTAHPDRDERSTGNDDEPLSKPAIRGKSSQRSARLFPSQLKAASIEGLFQ